MTPRPTIADAIEQSVRKLCENRSFVVGFGNHATPDEVFDIIMGLPCIADVTFSGSRIPSGFVIATELVDKYIMDKNDISSSFIEDLEVLESIAASTLAKLNEDWVIRQLEPSLFPDDKFIVPKIGSPVKFSFDCRLISGIVKKNKPTGHSVIFVKELGHVEEGKVGTQGVIVPWEQLIHEP